MKKFILVSFTALILSLNACSGTVVISDQEGGYITTGVMVSNKVDSDGVRTIRYDNVVKTHHVTGSVINVGRATQICRPANGSNNTSPGTVEVCTSI